MIFKKEWYVRDVCSVEDDMIQVKYMKQIKGNLNKFAWPDKVGSHYIYIYIYIKAEKTVQIRIKLRLRSNFKSIIKPPQHSPID